MVADCGQGWALLGWRPDGGVYFQYQVFSLYNNAGQRVQLPAALPNLPEPGWGVDWGTEFSANLNDIQPWCAVQAVADTDGNNVDVYFRSNSYNHKIFRFPDDQY